MNKAYDPNYARSPEHRRQVRRRFTKKAILVLLVMGLICLAIGLLALLVGLFRESIQIRLFRFSAIYGIAGIVMLALSGLLHLIRNLRHRRRNRKKMPAFEQEPVAGETGMVLILVLIILGLVAGLVAHVQMTSRSYLRREQFAHRRQQLLHAATDAVRDALGTLTADEEPSVDHLDEAWATPREHKNPDGVVTLVKIVDENRFFDLNNLSWYPTNVAVRPPADIFVDLMTLCGDLTPMNKADALIDWMDSGEQGAWETRHYESLNPPYPSANRILYGWDELICVEGFSRDFFAATAEGKTRDPFRGKPGDCMTILPRPRSEPVSINLNTAGRETLLGVLGIEQEELVRTILGLREIAPIYSAEQALSVVDPLLSERVRPYVDVCSRYYRIEARAYLEGQTINLHAMIERNKDGDIEVVEWYY